MSDRVLTIDMETRDPNIKLKKGAGWVYKDFEILGAAYKKGEAPALFTTDMELVRREVSEARTIICHNAQYDIGCLHRLGIDYKDKTIVDTVILAKLYDNTMSSYSLDHLSSYLLGSRKDYAALEEAAQSLGIKKYMDRMKDLFLARPELVAQYAKQDVELTYRLSQYFKKELYKEAIELVPFYSDLIKALVLWRSRGVRVDINQAKKSADILDALHKESLDKFYEYCPGVNIESTKQLAEAFINLGLTPGKSEKGGHSVDSKWRSTQNHPAIEALENAKKYQKLRREFVEGILERAENGRIYPELNIMGAAETGRFSSCVPMDTEALTRKGWKKYHELEIGEEILAYDIETDTQRWTPLLAKQMFKDQIIGVLGNDRTSYECTANHKWVNDNGWYKDRHYLSFQRADEFRFHHAIKVNSKYEGGPGAEISLGDGKYSTSWVEKVVNMSNEQLQCFVTGFLLADGHHQPPTKNGTKYSWQFTQVDGDILDAMHLAAYLLHDKRVSKASHGARQKDTHRPTSRVNLTASDRVVTKNAWAPVRLGDVWCPTTKYGTWVMRQKNKIAITCNSSPNIQQIPKRDGLAAELVRSIIVADEGENIYSLDFSSQEPRLQIHYAFLSGCKGADVIRESYLKNPAHDLHQQVADIAGIDRKQAKTINLGISYGMGIEKLSASLKIDEKSAKELISKYKKLTPYLHQLNKAVRESGEGKGFIRTLLGRRLKMDYEKPYKALNKLIQGSAADQTAMAMVQAYREGLPILFSVHDEAVMSSPNHEDAIRLKEIMETVARLEVPCLTEIQYGSSWGRMSPLS